MSDTTQSTPDNPPPANNHRRGSALPATDFPTPPHWKIWLSAARPRTLPAAIAPVIAATALAFHDGNLSPAPALLCLAFALLIQIATNFANDYYDHKKGTDTPDRVGPKRAVASGWVTPATMRRAMLATFALAFITGLNLLPFGGLPLLAIGIASILCGIAYTGGPFPLAYKGLGDLFVFIFFGLVATCATYYVQTATITTTAIAAAAAIGLLATNILLVNNYRDADTDALSNKKTLVVRLGKKFAHVQFAVFHLAALILLLFVTSPGKLLPLLSAAFWTAFTLLLILAINHTRRLVRDKLPPQQIALLSSTGAYLLLYTLVLSATLALSAPPNDAAQIRDASEQNFRALKTNDAQLLLSTISQNTLAHYQKRADLARTADKETLEKLPAYLRLQILSIRAVAAPGEIRAFTGADLFIAELQNNPALNSGAALPKITAINIQNNRAQILRETNTASPAREKFIKENKRWLIDTTDEIRADETLQSQNLKRIAEKENISENALILKILAQATGQPIPDTIWNPVE